MRVVSGGAWWWINLFDTQLLLFFSFYLIYGDIDHGLILTLITSWFYTKKGCQISRRKFSTFSSLVAKIFFWRVYSQCTPASSKTTPFQSQWTFLDLLGKLTTTSVLSWTSQTLAKPSNWWFDRRPSVSDRNWPKLGCRIRQQDFVLKRLRNKTFSNLWHRSHASRSLCDGHQSNYLKQRTFIFLKFLSKIFFCFSVIWHSWCFFKSIKFSPTLMASFSLGCAASVLVYFINVVLFSKNKA